MAQATPLSKFLIIMIALGLVIWGLFKLGFLDKVVPDLKKVATGNNSPSESVILRLHGSNTIGSQLAPKLAIAFLKQQGAIEINQVVGETQQEVKIKGQFPNQLVGVIEIQAHGSSTAFQELLNNQCDIGMASRRINSNELQSLAFLGNMTSPASEHVLALDGIAVIINMSNPIRQLSLNQIQRIFTGKIYNWSEVGGLTGPINLYVRDHKSGTYETFKQLVLNEQNLMAGVRSFESNAQLSAAVANDQYGIGFVAFSDIGNAKALSITDGNTIPLMPTHFTIKTEDYPLFRRLFLYTPANPENEWTRPFVEYALSKAGQAIVDQVGFVPLSIELVVPPRSNHYPQNYLTLTENAQRLSLNFRFETGSFRLDNRAWRDLDRIVAFLSQEQHRHLKVLLFGFSDSQGAATANLNLSHQRAQAVEKELIGRGVHPILVEGFGEAIPVATNDTEDGREKNRRVEIWVK